jgi:hypothetical protein
MKKGQIAMLAVKVEGLRLEKEIQRIYDDRRFSARYGNSLG